MMVNEKGTKADGPLFNPPGGTVKADIGGTFTTFHFNFISLDNTGASSLILPYQMDPESRQVWAAFTQVNVPIFSSMNSLPGLRRFDLEATLAPHQYNSGRGTRQTQAAFYSCAV